MVHCGGCSNKYRETCRRRLTVIEKSARTPTSGSAHVPQIYSMNSYGLLHHSVRNHMYSYGFLQHSVRNHMNVHCFLQHSVRNHMNFDCFLQHSVRNRMNSHGFLHHSVRSHTMSQRRELHGRDVLGPMIKTEWTSYVTGEPAVQNH